MPWLLRVGIGGTALTLVMVCFSLGRLTERQAEQAKLAQFEKTPEAASPISVRKKATEAPNQSENVIIANVATVSFGELWDVMRAATPERREAWTRDLEQLPPGTKRNAAIESFYKIWVELDPSAAVRAVENIADSRVRRLAFQALVHGAADSALPSIADLMLRLGYRPSDYREVLGRWADVDPEATGRFLVAHPAIGDPPFLGVTYSWGAVDPEAAGQWLASLQLEAWHDPPYPHAVDRRREEAALGLFLSWVERDRQGAVVYARLHADDAAVRAALGRFTLELCIRSPEEAKAFVQNLPNEASQRAAVTELLKNMTPLISFREGGDDEEPPDAEVDSKAVAPLLADLPPAVWSDHAGDIFAAWDTYDPGRANAWLHGLPPPIKAAAVVDYCGSSTIDQAEQVFELSSELDPESRNLALQKFVTKLQEFYYDPRSDIAASHLTKQRKQTLVGLLHHDQ